MGGRYERRIARLRCSSIGSHGKQSMSAIHACRSSTPNVPTMQTFVPKSQIFTKLCRKRLGGMHDGRQIRAQDCTTAVFLNRFAWQTINERHPCMPFEHAKRANHANICAEVTDFH